MLQEICILALAVEWEGNSMTLLNFIGLLMCLGGIIFHVIHKAKSTVVSHKPYIDEASARFLPEGGSSSSDDETGHGEDSSTEVLFSVLNSRDR